MKGTGAMEKPLPSGLRRGRPKGMKLGTPKGLWISRAEAQRRLGVGGPTLDAMCDEWGIRRLELPGLPAKFSAVDVSRVIETHTTGQAAAV